MTDRAPATRPSLSRLLVGLHVTLLTALALVAPAGAQSSPSTLPGGGTPTVVKETPSNTAGAIVFFVVVAVIIGGAVILYLRHRPPRAV